MSDDVTPTDDAPGGVSRLDVRQSKPSIWRRISFVWLVPILALFVSVGVAWQSFSDRGVEVEIRFENASGVTAGQTEIRYRDVTIGAVERVEFGPDLQEVLVYARVDRNVAPFLDQDATFWVVRPEVGLRGVSGLDTVLSGVYIAGDWDRDAGEAQVQFTARTTAPLASAGQTGTMITLRTDDGSALSAGAPVLHQGIEVGTLGAPVLQDDGLTVLVDAFVAAPYDAIITSSTRFWDTAGFSVSLGAAGVSLNVGSLASLLEGGIAFDTVVSGGDPITNGQVFDLFTDEESARSSLFNNAGRPKLNVAVLFDGSITGLSIGAEVRFQGLRVGQVADLGAVVVDDPEGTRVELRTVLAIEPDRLGLGAEATPDEALELLAEFVGQGLRARLVSGNILSGSLVVELVEVADAPEAVLDLAAQPYPVIPTTVSNITDVADQAQGVINRINNLPIEEIMTSAIDLMDSANALVRSDGVMQTPEQVAGLLADARGLIGSEGIQSVPDDIAAVVAQAATILGQVNGVMDQIGSADVVGSVTRTVANVEEGTQNLSEISASAQELLNKVNALQLDALLTEATAALDAIAAVAANPDIAEVPVFLNQLLDEARGLIASGDVQALPGELRNVANSANTILSDLTSQGVSEQLTQAITAAANAARTIDEASQQLPAITAQLDTLSANAAGMDLQGLSAAAETTLGNIDALIGTPSAQALPASLSSALDEVQLFLNEIREGGAVNNVNAALQSANTAAQAIEEAARTLPALSAQTGALVASTGTVLESYGERSRFNSETLSTLRDIQAAADAVSNLAQAIQRNPNSLITGR
ncbi:paraquat-inducible protein B [Loktanella fryxellensis]|uniref:Paraquat-inducible protein B n=1 Tax=Loktanella fryxellensis TaxID=245187 RepID=A0A1H8BQL8_9RHOB|nr:MlaD family protein [Loktanella fryxellensis]SEM84839.1 paraquat-inducible protein B [Loktanella fryxellensis]